MFHPNIDPEKREWPGSSGNSNQAGRSSSTEYVTTRLPLTPHQRHREVAIRRRASSELDAIIARLYGGDRRAA